MFAESIGNLISFIEAHPLVKASELAPKMLGSRPRTAPPSPGAEGEDRRMQGDLIWLVREGYVTEFIDGGLYAPPAMVEARKKEVEAEEVDPENFPEVPAGPPRRREAQAAPAAESAPESPAAAPALAAESEAPPPTETSVA